MRENPSSFSFVPKCFIHGLRGVTHDGNTNKNVLAHQTDTVHKSACLNKPITSSAVSIFLGHNNSEQNRNESTADVLHLPPNTTRALLPAKFHTTNESNSQTYL